MYAADQLRGIDGDSRLDITDAQKYLDLAEHTLISSAYELAQQLDIPVSDDLSDEEQEPG